MHLNRFGFNLIVAIYLIPMALIDFVCNSMVSGAMSDYYLYKFILDAGLAAIAVSQLFRAQTAHHATAQERVQSGDDVIGFENVSSLEYLYCATLCLYAAANTYFMHAINKASTGALSMASLAWMLLSIVICGLAGLQFWHLKSGTIVQLRQRVTQ
jgi:hypothetical protein